MSIRSKFLTTRALAQAGIIAALYVALVLSNAMFSYGMIQIRIAEALTILPLFMPAAIPGVFIGCLIANIFSPFPNIIDIVFGSLTSLLASIMTYQIGRDLAKTKVKELPKFLLAAIPPVLANAIIVGTYVGILWYPAIPVYLVMLSVGAGQVVACYLLGGFLYFGLRKTKLGR